MAPQSNLHLAGDTNLYNLNSDLLCALDLVTSGNDPRKDNIIEICILPLNSFLKPHKTILPYNIMLEPNRDNVDLTNLPKRVKPDKIYEACHNGIHPYVAADRLEEWFQKIKFKFNKKLTILTYDFIKKYHFLINWLGILNYEKIFSYKYRDLLPAALAFNDRADFHSEVIPFPKVHLQYICSQLKVEAYTRKMDTLQNCISIAEAYSIMIKQYT